MSDHHGLGSGAAIPGTVDEVVEEIRRRSLHSVRLAFADVHGVLRGKTIRADLVADAFAGGVGITSALLMKDTGQHNVYPVWAPGGGLGQPWLTGAGDMMMRPDPSTFRVLPWADGTGWLLCDLFSPAGEPIDYSTRRLCAEVSRDFETATGCRLRAGLEVEFHLFHRAESAADADADASRLSPIHPGWMYLGENRFDSIEPILEPFRSGLTALGLPPRSLEIELGPGQVEMTFSPADVLARGRPGRADPLGRQADRRPQWSAGHLHEPTLMFPARSPRAGTCTSRWSTADGTNLFTT